MWGSGPCTKGCGCPGFRVPGGELSELEKLRIEQGNPLTDNERIERLRGKVSYLDERCRMLESTRDRLPLDEAVRWIGMALDVMGGAPPAVDQKVSMAELRDRLLASGAGIHRDMVELRDAGYSASEVHVRRLRTASTIAFDEELDAAKASGEVRGPLVDAMVDEIRSHREAFLGRFFPALRLYTDEVKRLRAMRDGLLAWRADMDAGPRAASGTLRAIARIDALLALAPETSCPKCGHRFAGSTHDPEGKGCDIVVNGKRCGCKEAP